MGRCLCCNDIRNIIDGTTWTLIESFRPEIDKMNEYDMLSLDLEHVDFKFPLRAACPNCHAGILTIG